MDSLKKFGSKLVDEVSDGFDIKGVVQGVDGNTPCNVCGTDRQQ
jgi:hypothetical protein